MVMIATDDVAQHVQPSSFSLAEANKSVTGVPMHCYSCLSMETMRAETGLGGSIGGIWKDVPSADRQQCKGLGHENV